MFRPGLPIRSWISTTARECDARLDAIRFHAARCDETGDLCARKLLGRAFCSRTYLSGLDNFADGGEGVRSMV